MKTVSVDQAQDHPPATFAPDEGNQFATILGIRPKTLHEAMEIATLIASSDLVPKDFKGKPANVLLAWEMSQVLGIPPIQGIRNIAVINGRASIWGELGTAIVRNHALTEYLIMSTPEDVKKNSRAWTRLKRKDQEQVIEYSFSIEDAKTAKLWGNQGPWTQYPYWMLQMRANSFCFKLGASDMLGGMAIAEESGDIIELREAKDKVYEMPKKTAPAAAVDAKPVEAETVKSEEKATSEEAAGSAPAGDIITAKVYSIAKAELSGQPVYVLRTEPNQDKFYTDNDDVAAYAKKAMKEGKAVAIVTEKRGSATWIVEIEGAA